MSIVAVWADGVWSFRLDYFVRVFFTALGTNIEHLLRFLDRRLSKREVSLIRNLDCPVHCECLKHVAVERLKWSKLRITRLGSFQPGTCRAPKCSPIIGARLAIAPPVNV